MDDAEANQRKIDLNWELCIDMPNLCRSCLCQLNKDFFWLESYYLDQKIVDIYKNVTSIEIDLNEYMPKKICTKCYNVVIKFDQFKTRALECEKILGDSVFSASADMLDDKDKIKFLEVKKCDSDSDNNEKSDNRNGSVKRKYSIEDLRKCEKENDENSESDSDDMMSASDGDAKAQEDLQDSSTTVDNEYSEERTEPKTKRRIKREACKVCGKMIDTYKMLTHMRVHTKEKPYGCDICGLTFAEKSNLGRHLKIHGTKRPHVCSICGKGFLRPSSKAIHEMTAHVTAKNEVCELCGKMFKNTLFLRKHKKRIHYKTEAMKDNEEEDEDLISGYPCLICGNVYMSKSSLSVHKMKHDVPKGFLCTICGKGYTTKAVLENHQKVHTGEKDLCCEFCPKKFRFISTLKTHIMESRTDKHKKRTKVLIRNYFNFVRQVHKGEKPLACPLCDKRFRQHAHLKAHVRGQHTGSRPFECNYCKKTFKHSCNLTVHTRIHTGETPYLCDICGKGFYDSSSMKKHKRGHPNYFSSEYSKTQGEIGE